MKGDFENEWLVTYLINYTELFCRLRQDATLIVNQKLSWTAFAILVTP